MQGWRQSRRVGVLVSAVAAAGSWVVRTCTSVRADARAPGEEGDGDPPAYRRVRRLRRGLRPVQSVTLGKLLLILLAIPLLIVIAKRNPQGMAHLVKEILMVDAKLLNATAAFLSGLLGGHT